MEYVLAAAAVAGIVVVFRGDEDEDELIPASEEVTPEEYAGPVTTFHADIFTIQLGEYLVPKPIFGGEAATWEWKVWQTGIYEANIGDLAGREVAKGDATSSQQAEQDARTWIAQEMGGLGAAPTPDPIPSPDPSPGAGEAITRVGVRIAADCSAVEVTDLPAWIEYARVYLKTVESQTPNASDLMASAFADAFPECEMGLDTEIRGQSWVQVAQGVQNVLDKSRAGEFLAVEPVEDVIAARIVGMSVPARDGVAVWHVGKNSGMRFAIVVEQITGGYTYRVWTGSRIGDPDWSGVGLNLAGALQGARAQADKVVRAQFSPGAGS